MKKIATISTIAACILLIFSGCAHLQVDARLAEYKEILESLTGVATKDDILIKFGIPEKKSITENLEVWEFHRSYGTRWSAQAYSNPYGYSTTAYGGSREVYDQLTLFFDNSGLLENWKVYVQR
jgi:hypothetical protein